MTRDDLVVALLAERFGPLPTAVRQSTLRRRRELAAALEMSTAYDPPATPERDISADVAQMAARRWSAEQIAALLGVDVARVRRLMPAPDESVDT